MSDVLQYLEDGKLTEKANVIRTVYENPSDTFAKKFDNILKGKKNSDDEIPVAHAAAIQLYLNQSQSDYQALKNQTDEIGEFIITDKMVHFVHIGIYSLI